MDIFATAVTLFLIMDPLGNIPLFLSVLRPVAPERRQKVIVRELLIALALMLVFLFSGPSLLRVLGLSPQAVAIGGGLVLMIIAIRMIFPLRGAALMGDDDDDNGEPLLVPLATPLVAGPSLLATLILLRQSSGATLGGLLVALLLAWGITCAILLFAQNFYRLLGTRGLKAIERLMGMILICVSVQMLLNGFIPLLK